MDRERLQRWLSKINHNPQPKKARGARRTKDVVPFSNPHSKLYDEFDKRFPLTRDKEGNKVRRRVDREGIKNEYTNTFYFGEPIATKLRVAQQVTLNDHCDVRFETCFEQNHDIPVVEKVPIIEVR